MHIDVIAELYDITRASISGKSDCFLLFLFDIERILQGL